MRILFNAVALSLGAIGAVEAGSQWEIATNIAGEQARCELAGAELVLVGADGLDVSRQAVSFGSRPGETLEETWDVPSLAAGQYFVDCIVKDCQGEVLAVHRLTTQVSTGENRKHLVLVAESTAAEFAIDYLDITTEMDGDGVFDVTFGKGKFPRIRYLGDTNIQRCDALGANITLEWKVAGEWGGHGAIENIDWLPEKETVQHDEEIPTGWPMVRFIRSWHECTRLVPQAKRLKIRVSPPEGNRYRMESRPHISIVPGCDIYVVSLPLTDDEPTFCAPPQDIPQPDLEPAAEEQ